MFIAGEGELLVVFDEATILKVRSTNARTGLRMGAIAPAVDLLQQRKRDDRDAHIMDAMSDPREASRSSAKQTQIMVPIQPLRKCYVCTSTKEHELAETRQNRTLEVATPYCAAEDMGDEIVALNVETGIYFSMRGLAAVLWRDFEAGYPVEDLVTHIKNATGSDSTAAAFTAQLLHYGLMREADRAPVDALPAIVVALIQDKGDVILEVFEDMKDLILSDPIHDVDETAGWPTKAAPRKDHSADDAAD